MKSSAQDSYSDYRILTASPLARVRMLYDRAIVEVEAARESLERHNPEERAQHVSAAFSILTELIAALNPEAAPELCDRLKRLYEYMQWRLVTAHSGRDDHALEEVASLLRSVGEVWVEQPKAAPEQPAEPRPRALNPYERQGAARRGNGPVYL